VDRAARKTAARKTGVAGSAAPRSRPVRARNAVGGGLVLGFAWCWVAGLWSTLVTLAILVHLAYLLYVLLGGFLAVHRTWLLWPHLAASTWGVVGAIWALPCPLTMLEKWLRVQAGSSVYPGNFIGYYLDGTVWPTGQTGDVWQLTAMTVVASYVVVLRQVARAPART